MLPSSINNLYWQNRSRFCELIKLYRSCTLIIIIIIICYIIVTIDIATISVTDVDIDELLLLLHQLLM